MHILVLSKDLNSAYATGGFALVHIYQCSLREGNPDKKPWPSKTGGWAEG